MPDDKEPTQKTAKGYEIPVPKRDQVLWSAESASRP
jgi:hypothetical protein